MRSTKSPSWSSRLLGLDPQPVPPHVFGIDQQRLRYGQFPSNGDGVRFAEYHSVELPVNSFNEGPLGGSLKEAANFREAVAELVAKISTPVSEASLVLPDGWLRLAFTETEALPHKVSEREELLRWKLKLQVPFRVEDLRVGGVEVPPLASQEDSIRVLMGFGISQLLDQIEGAFEDAGVRLGHISNESLSLLVALGPALRGVDLGAVALVAQNYYSLLITVRGEPLVHRFKAYHPELPAEAMGRFVVRDLRLTRTFLAERLGNDEVQRMVLISPDERQGAWSGWLEDVFGKPPGLLGEEWPFLSETSPGVAAHEVAPMFGAACREVA